MDEAARNKINGQLTLPLLKNKSPFALSEKERLFTPDDWAWLFLRLNKKYRAAYNEENESLDANTSSVNILSSTENQSEWAQPRPRYNGLKISKIKKSKSESFGLGDWICPEIKFLEELSLTKNGSWFHPLMRTLCCGGTSKIINGKSVDMVSIPRMKPNIGLAAIETPFGFERYHKPDRLYAPQRIIVHPKNNLIRALIKCDIPPAGQMASILQLAKITRHDAMSIERLKSHRTIKTFKVSGIDDCEWISRLEWSRFAQDLVQVRENPAVWRAIE